MRPPVPQAYPGPDALTAAAVAAGLVVRACAGWPETPADDRVPPLAGFIESTFSPLVAQVAGRALSRRDEPPGDQVTALVIVTALGDVTSATRVAAAVDAGTRVPPLLFFQSVPNSVAGYVAARWHLTGPVACVTGTAAGLAVAAIQIQDADADEVLVVRVDVAVTDGDRDRAAAVVVTGPTGRNRPGTAES